MTTLERIQSWFVARCDGSWEHQHGINIATIDNPGWFVEVDVPPEGPKVPLEHVVDRSETDWLRCSVSDGKVRGYCGPENLEELLEAILKWLEQR